MDKAVDGSASTTESNAKAGVARAAIGAAAKAPIAAFVTVSKVRRTIEQS